ncbi:MAG: 4Fe-4S dicluster domain-containing protein [Candidatus Coatesbacteria bacterium]|nr:4Fe-4S dicluster domain-containing protein [Candidatus Coatesbacteria bacterium]
MPIDEHALKIDEGRCTGCVECTRSCPAKAIRVRDGIAEVMAERCIDCGECYRVCPQGAIVPVTTTHTDLSAFKYKVALPSPALYSQFGPNILPEDVLHALLSIGFDLAYDKAYACEMVFGEVKDYIEQNHSREPFISPVCPAVTRLVQLMFPELTSLILPFRPPREVAAKAIKMDVSNRLGIREDEIAVIHITPCLAKLAAMINPPTGEKSYLDGAVGISEIYAQLLTALKQREKKVDEIPELLHRSSGMGIGFGRVGGEVTDLGFEESLAVSGVQDTISILRDLERRKLQNMKYLECQICPGGCIGGPLTVQNRYIASHTISKFVGLFGSKPQVEEMMKSGEQERAHFRLAKSINPVSIPPLDTDTSFAIGKMRLREEILRKLPGKNCAACGAPDCLTLADDIVRGRASIEDCVFIRADGQYRRIKGKGARKR